MSEFHAVLTADQCFLHLFLSLLATGRQKEKTEVESSLESAIARPATVLQGII